ncbi:hypothetical protein APA_1423 [Pseudanabaena sp. lw0831]|nr:hypothetical protein APA_1423 [Pseudanabaena sp. lw0831]
MRLAKRKQLLLAIQQSLEALRQKVFFHGVYILCPKHK